MQRPASKPAPVSKAKPGTPAPKGPTRGRTNTLGLNTNELNAVFDQLDGGGADNNLRRQSARLSFRQESIGVEIVQPGGGQTQMHCACRNLSRTGLGLLHSSYIHVGTTVVLTLIHHDGSEVRVRGKVMRCRHVTRHVHDVGVRFNEPINIRDFMSLDPLKQTFTCELVNPEHLKGTLLLVAEYKMEQACVQTMLKGTPMEVIVAAGVEQGLECARKGVGIILCDDMFEKGSGVEFVQAARKQGVRCPIILMSAETSEAALDRFRKAEADAFLAKPLDQGRLLRAVAEFMLATGDKAESSGPLHSTLPDTSPMKALADDFVTDLHTLADTIEKLMAAGDATGIRRQCLRIGGPATSLGYEPIAKMAATLVKSLDAAKSLDQCSMPLNTFMSVCRCARKAAPKTESAAEGASGAEAENENWEVDPGAGAEGKGDGHAKAGAHAPPSGHAPAAGHGKPAHAKAPAAPAAKAA